MSKQRCAPSKSNQRRPFSLAPILNGMLRFSNGGEPSTDNAAILLLVPYLAPKLRHGPVRSVAAAMIPPRSLTPATTNNAADRPPAMDVVGGNHSPVLVRCSR